MASGLVILTGPFCFTAQAQDYVDVEAELGGETTTPATPATATPSSATPAYTSPQPTTSAPAPAADPYKVSPAQPYPATSYGVDSGPTAPVTTTMAAPTPLGGAVGGGQQNVGNLFLQVQQLQQEVMRLNGMVEEQANELRKLKEQSLERYVDLDRRLSTGGTGGSGATAVAPVTVTGSGGNSGAAEQPGESDAYRAAYALVRGQQFDEAVTAFRGFLQSYPDGKYAANAHYWLGELYLVIQPVDPESSRQAFTLLLNQYPDNPKAPDAMFKLGKVYYMKGNREKAREYLDKVIRDYGNSNSSAVKLAQDFIDENY